VPVIKDGIPTDTCCVMPSVWYSTSSKQTGEQTMTKKEMMKEIFTIAAEAPATRGFNSMKDVQYALDDFDERMERIKSYADELWSKED
jgi:hypothetical protein